MELVNIIFFLYSNMDLIDISNCIGLLKNGKCSRFNIFQCQGDCCPFKLTKEDVDKSKRYIKERLSQLDEETQDKIANKYYGGKRFWRETQA